jgi:putative ATPase
MKELGHADGYRYSHNDEHGYTPNAQYFPDGLESERFYFPVDRGLEIKIKEKLERLRQLDADDTDAGS